MPSYTHQIIPVTAFQQNCSLLICQATKKAALIDPGGEPERLLAAIQAEGATLEKIFLTHGHLDHVGASKALSEQFNVPIEGPAKGDDYWLEGLPDYAEMMQFPKTEAFVPTKWLVEGDELQVGEVRMKVFQTPGHTPGHLIFFEPEEKLAFVGDVLFQGSIGRTDFPGGDYHTLIQSIVTKLLPLGDDVRFVPGHGPMSTLGFEKQHNPFLQDVAF